MIGRNGGVFCSKCGLPMVHKGDGNFVCYDKNCDYTFHWEVKVINGEQHISMSSSFGIDIYLPPDEDGEDLKGILRK